MYIMCVSLFSALSRRIGALQISIIIIIINKPSQHSLQVRSRADTANPVRHSHRPCRQMAFCTHSSFPVHLAPTRPSFGAANGRELQCDHHRPNRRRCHYRHRLVFLFCPWFILHRCLSRKLWGVLWIRTTRYSSWDRYNTDSTTHVTDTTQTVQLMWQIQHRQYNSCDRYNTDIQLMWQIQHRQYKSWDRYNTEVQIMRQIQHRQYNSYARYNTDSTTHVTDTTQLKQIK